MRLGALGPGSAPARGALPDGWTGTGAVATLRRTGAVALGPARSAIQLLSRDRPEELLRLVAGPVVLAVRLPARIWQLLDDADEVLALAAGVLREVDTALPGIVRQLQQDVLPALAGLAATERDVTVVRAGLESLLARFDVVAEELSALPGVTRLARRRADRDGRPI